MENYMKTAFEELYEKDGLTIMGRGLGIEVLFSKFIQYYSEKGNNKFILCLNATGVEQAIRDLILAEGVSPDELPTVSIIYLYYQDSL
jgi:hypothetical protein